MKKSLLLLVPLFFLSGNVQAGKSDDIVAAMSKNCGMDVSKKKAAKMIKKLFLCSPGAKVKVGSCTLSCLKANTGNVAGQ